MSIARTPDAKGTLRCRLSTQTAYGQISVVIDGRSIVEGYTKHRLPRDFSNSPPTGLHSFISAAYPPIPRVAIAPAYHAGGRSDDVRSSKLGDFAQKVQISLSLYKGTKTILTVSFEFLNAAINDQDFPKATAVARRLPKRRFGRSSITTNAWCDAKN
jgi:hypothetical protein